MTVRHVVLLGCEILIWSSEHTAEPHYVLPSAWSSPVCLFERMDPELAISFNEKPQLCQYDDVYRRLDV